MASRQPKWTGDKTHAVLVRYPDLGLDVWHRRGTYRHRSHACRACIDLSQSEPEHEFRVVPLSGRKAGAEFYQEIDTKEPSDG